VPAPWPWPEPDRQAASARSLSRSARHRGEHSRPALHRLAEKGGIAGEWGQLENGRRAKLYALTSSGRAQLAKEKRNWQKVQTAVNQVLAEEV